MQKSLFQKQDSMCFLERIMKDGREGKSIIKGTDAPDKMLQVCKRLVKQDVLHSKYKISYEELQSEIKDLYMSYCCAGMIRNALDVNDYCELLRTEFVKHNREFSDACKYLSGKPLEIKLKRIRDEMLEAEHEYCNQFILLPDEPEQKDNKVELVG